MSRLGDRHLTEDEWYQFIAGELARPEARMGVRHLLAGCPQCAVTCSAVFSNRPYLQLPSESRDISERRNLQEFEATVASVSKQNILLSSQKVLALGQWAHLALQNPEQRRERIRSDPKFQTVGLFERLLELSRWAHRYDAAQAVTFAETAYFVAESFTTKRFPSALLADNRVVALAHLANANRIAGDVLAAEAALAAAWRLLPEGSGDPMDEALLHRHQANLALELRRFEEAELSYERAYSIYWSCPGFVDTP